MVGIGGVEPPTSRLSEVALQKWLFKANKKMFSGNSKTVRRDLSTFQFKRGKAFYSITHNFMKMHNETLEEANLLFEMIKTMLITGLPQTHIGNLLKSYTHYEIRN